MITRAPWPRSDSAQPLPTSPYPQTTATLPPIMTSVARLRPSISEWRQPYLLSNLLLVTESLTLIAGNSSVPSRKRSYRRRTPVVVSSETPLMSLEMLVQCCGLVSTERASTRSTSLNSSLSVLSCDGTTPVFSYSTPRCSSIVMSPPSSSRTVSPPSAKSKTFSASSQYSASDSPFHAKTG